MGSFDYKARNGRLLLNVGLVTFNVESVIKT